MGASGRAVFSPISEAPPTLTDKRQTTDLERVGRGPLPLLSRCSNLQLARVEVDIEVEYCVVAVPARGQPV